MTSREKFEVWYLENWGHTEDDHETLFDRYPDSDEEYYRLGVRMAHGAWQASEEDMAVQLANAESKCRELAAEISRRDEIFIPVYPDNNLMNKMTDVFHETAKIHCDEDGIFVDNAELVITSIINNYIKSDDAFLAEVRAQARNEGINYAAGRLAAAFNHGFVDKPLTEVCDVVRMILDAKEELENSTLPAADGLSGEYAEKFLAEFAAQLRKGDQ
ncbi:TPA: hypothetical protein ACHS7Y_001756 [Citrobacter freundii]